MVAETIMTVEVAEAGAVGLKAIGAGLAVGLAGMGTGLAQFGIGSAAVGATAENKEIFGLALLFTVIPETVVIFGLVIALLLLF